MSWRHENQPWQHLRIEVVLSDVKGDGVSERVYSSVMSSVFFSLLVFSICIPKDSKLVWLSLTPLIKSNTINCLYGTAVTDRPTDPRE